MSSSSHSYQEPSWQGGRSTAWLAQDEVEQQTGSMRFWMAIVLGLCLLCVAGILGGYVFGAKIMQGSHLREQFATGQDSSAQPLALGVNEQSRKLTGHQENNVRYYSGPSELAAAAARGEVVIDDKGIVHEVSLETPLSEPGVPELDAILQAVPETLPPMPQPLPDLPGERMAQAATQPDALAAYPGEPSAHERRGQGARSDDIFFGQ